MYVKGALNYKCNCKNTLYLIVAISYGIVTIDILISNYFTSVYMLGFLKFGRNLIY